MSFAICTLLLTCTFCSLLNAQEPPENRSVNSLLDSTKIKVGGAELIMIKLLLEYDKKCYDDSTKFEGAVYKLTDGTKFIGSRPKPYEYMTNYVKDTTYYYHRQPDFADFVRWAAKKYGL